MNQTVSRTDIEENVLAKCKSLCMTSAIPEMVQQEGSIEQLEYLAVALGREEQRREENKGNNLLKKARFPAYKTFENYDFHNVKLPPMLSREELENLNFVEEKNNLILYGPVGIGKTHMAIAAGVNACRKGYKVRFYTVSELVVKLAETRSKGKLQRFLNELNKLDLLILDEWGYVPIDRDGSQLLFHVIASSYEKKSLILTTNLEFSKWGSIFTDEQMAAAMIDRLVHHGHLLLFEGTSYRMEHALMRQTARQPSKNA